MTYFSISWDEENSPKPFLWTWTVAQTLLLVSYFLTKTHILKDMALERPGNPGWIQGFGIVEYICCMAALVLYCQLVFNGIFHRTTPDPDADETESLNIHALDLSDVSPKAPEAPEEPVFGSSLKKMSKLDPVETRDDIQWKRILLGTCGMATIVASFILMFQ